MRISSPRAGFQAKSRTGMIAAKALSPLEGESKTEAGAVAFDFELRVAVILADRIYQSTPV